MNSKVFKIVAVIIILSTVISGCIFTMKKEKIGLPTDDLEKIEISIFPIKEDLSNIRTITDEQEMYDYINMCNSMKVKKTHDTFGESPNVCIRVYYKNDTCYQLESNENYSEEELLSVSKIRFTDNGIQLLDNSEFFYTNEINKLID